MRQWWVCFWYLQWSYALAARRQALWAAEAKRDSVPEWGSAKVLRAERRVNKALAKRAKWRKRGACENCRRAAAQLEA